MSKALDIELCEMLINAPRWRRYPVLIVKTLKMVVKKKPDIIIAQNPSVVLAALSLFLGRLLKVIVIIDAHNAGLFPVEGRYPVLNIIALWLNNRAKAVIVTNDKLKNYIENDGGVAFSIPDPVPEIACASNKVLSADSFNIVFVCSWADDEPYLEVMKAASQIGKEVKFYFTGDSKGRHARYGKNLPENVIRTGFLSNTEYENLLCSCDAVMVLTKRDDCLVCGAYEGVSVMKPMVLSDKAILRSHFSEGCVYTENNADDIKKAIDKVMASYDDLSKSIEGLKVDISEMVEEKLRVFKAEMLTRTVG